MKLFARSLVSFVLSVFVVTTATAAISIQTVSKEVGKEGGAFSVNTVGSGSWTATTDADWITVSRASGEAGVSCIIAVNANFSADTRVGIVDIAGNTFTVYQTGYEATLSPTSATASCEGGSGTIVVTVDAGVAWSAVPNVEWITVEPMAGRSSGEAVFTVAANEETTTRSGSITIAGRIFPVTQTGTDITLLPAEKTLDCRANVFEVRVGALADTEWRPIPEASWLSVLDDGHGYGNSTILVAVGDNPSVLARTGTVAIGSKKLTVTQTGTTNLYLSITPETATASAVGAYGNIAVFGTPDALWTTEVIGPDVIAFREGFDGLTDTASLPEGWSGSGASSSSYGGESAPSIVLNGNHSNLVSKTFHLNGPGVLQFWVKGYWSRNGSSDLSVQQLVSDKWVTIDSLTPEIGGDFEPVRYPLDPGATRLQFLMTYNGNMIGIDDVEVWHPSRPSWITISSGDTGEGNGNIKYMVTANPLLEEREGYIKVILSPGEAGGEVLESVHTVRQTVIEPVVEPTVVSFEAAGGSASVQLTVAENTQWTAKGNESWIQVTSAPSSSGSAKVWFDAAPNPSTEGRTGTLEIAGKTVTVSQAGLWSKLTYDGKVFGTSSDSGFIDVQVEGDGTWTASSDSPWLTLMDLSGHGSDSVMFVVDDFNTAVASRTAVVTIAGKTVEITQRGYELSIDPAVADLGSNAGAGEIGISAPIDALWEAIVTVDWIRLVGETTGLGNGTLRYTVMDNTSGELRTGKIIISGQEYTITQHANLTLTTKVEGSGSVEGAGDYETNERVTLRAVPDEGFAFTHWSGDAVGVEPEVTIVMDMPKTVTAHFIPEDAAQRLAEEKAAQGGFYTREQMRALAMGDTVIEVEDGTVDLAFELQECADLAGGDWGGVDAGEGEVGVDGEGKVHIRVAPKGNVAFYRLMGGGGE